MDSDYVKQLDAWIKEKGITKQDANVAAFLAVREHVKARLEDGYSATVIFAYLRDTKQIDVKRHRANRCPDRIRKILRVDLDRRVSERIWRRQALV